MLLRVFGCAPKHRFTETERRRDAAGRIGGAGAEVLVVDCGCEAAGAPRDWRAVVFCVFAL